MDAHKHQSGNKKGIAAIIFDYGNVIDRFDQYIFLRKLAAHTDKTPDELYELIFGTGLERRHETGQISPKQFFEEAVRICGLKGITLEEFEEAFVEKYTPIPETYELIRRLKQNGYRLGLLTNTSATYFEGRTSQLGIFPLFDAVTTSFQTGLMKPDRRMYEDIARKLGASPEQCLLIDDIAEYAEEARQIRMKAIHYQSPEQLVDELKREGIRI